MGFVCVCVPSQSTNESVLTVEFNPLDSSSIITSGKSHVYFWTWSGTTLTKKQGIFGVRGSPGGLGGLRWGGPGWGSFCSVEMEPKAKSCPQVGDGVGGVSGVVWGFLRGLGVSWEVPGGVVGCCGVSGIWGWSLGGLWGPSGIFYVPGWSWGPWGSPGVLGRGPGGGLGHPSVLEGVPGGSLGGLGVPVGGLGGSWCPGRAHFHTPRLHPKANNCPQGGPRGSYGIFGVPGWSCCSWEGVRGGAVTPSPSSSPPP